MADFAYLRPRLDRLDAGQRLRRLVPRAQEGIWLQQQDNGRRMLNFGSNDYLGLAAESVANASLGNACGRGSMASPLVCGWTLEHQHLAERLAVFESAESVVLFPSGFAACSGTVATLAEAGDLILSDALNHASLIDGCRLAAAERCIFPHRDVAAVESLLQQRRPQFQRVWIVTDAVFSMDGHVAPLRQLCDLADCYDAHLIVDEAHATGVLGETGGGLCEALGVKTRVAIRVGTLSKAIGSQGGFVAAPRLVTDFLTNCCRTLIYSTALAPAAVRAAERALDAIEQQPQRRETLQQLANQFRSRVQQQMRLPRAIDDENDLESGIPIIPIPMRDDRQVVQASRELAELGFYVPAIRPPTVPEGSARLRVSLTAVHPRESVEALADVMVRLRGSR